MKRLFSLVLALTLLSACATAVVPLTAAELLDLGEKYLLEQDYEQALVQFTKLIEIEPMNPRGYTGAAEAYVGLGHDDKVVDVLLDGLVKLPNHAEIMSMLQNSLLFAGAVSNKSDYIDENGVRVVTLGKTDENSNRTGFWIENHYDTESGSLIFLREGYYIDGKLNGNDKCMWIDESTAAKFGMGYGFGVGNYVDDKRNGYQSIECFIEIKINAAANAVFIRFEDCIGEDLVYVYKGSMTDEILEDNSGTAYQMWVDDEKIEYIGEFHGGTRNGTGKMWGSDWEFSGQFINGKPTEG